MTVTPSETVERLDIQLDTIARVIRGWLDWHRKHRDDEHIVTDGDTCIMCLPVPVWPSHAQFENWIEALEEARMVIKGRTTP